MNKNPKSPYIISGFLIIIVLSFLAGAFSYRAGALSKIKSMLLPAATQTPEKPISELQPDFAFEFLENLELASMNSIPLEDNAESLTFLVSGHIYGKPGDDEFHPAPTLVRNISLLRKLNPDFVVVLGDTVWKPTDENFNILETLILESFEIPVFNAVGNHDVTKRDLYQSRYGSTVYSFQYKDQLFFILDTTLNYYNLTADQVSFVEATINQQIQSSNINGINLFMHHILFLDEEEVVGKQLLKPNEGDGISATFQDFLKSILYPISQSVPIYVYAGDVGAFQGGNLSPLYKKNPDYDVTFFATGLGNHQFDSILIVKENKDHLLTITPFSLTEKEMKSIEDYDFHYWLSK